MKPTDTPSRGQNWSKARPPQLRGRAAVGIGRLVTRSIDGSPVMLPL